MSSIDSYILGNEVLHDRFSATTQIVGLAVCNAPEPVTIQELKEVTGRSARELAKLCGGLSLGGVFESTSQKCDAWRLACKPEDTTLEDVFRCLLADPSDRSRQVEVQRDRVERSYRDLDLLLMQVSIAINQSVFRQLRQITLQRLKISVNGLFPFSRRPPPKRERDVGGRELATGTQ
jgi:DNA-binding IscR family transcriptional regulator